MGAICAGLKLESLCKDPVWMALNRFNTSSHHVQSDPYHDQPSPSFQGIHVHNAVNASTIYQRQRVLVLLVQVKCPAQGHLASASNAV